MGACRAHVVCYIIAYPVGDPALVTLYVNRYHRNVVIQVFTRVLRARPAGQLLKQLTGELICRGALLRRQNCFKQRSPNSSTPWGPRRTIRRARPHRTGLAAALPQSRGFCPKNLRALCVLKRASGVHSSLNNKSAIGRLKAMKSIPIPARSKPVRGVAQR